MNKATDNRLAASLKFVYEQIQNMFAKDTIDRFIVMCTFSDGKKPLAIAAIEEAKFLVNTYFKFNNSAMFEAHESLEKIDRTLLTFFQLGYANFRDFCNHIKK